MKYPVLIIYMIFIFISPGFAQQDTIFKSFSVSQTDDGVLINFTIRGGITCSGVQIERSGDNVFFEEIYEFAGVCGGLNTDESYSFTDLDPIKNATALYRLDLGSLGLYSGVISVKYIDYDFSGISIFPNPCADECALYFSNTTRQPHNALLFDRHGKLVLNEIITGESWNFKTKKLNPGIYYYIINRNEELRFSGNILII